MKWKRSWERLVIRSWDLRSFPIKTHREGTVDSKAVIGRAVRGSGSNSARVFAVFC